MQKGDKKNSCKLFDNYRENKEKKKGTIKTARMNDKKKGKSRRIILGRKFINKRKKHMPFVKVHRDEFLE